MFKKLIISAFAAIALMVGMQAPASAAMGVAKPAVAQSEAAASEIVKVGGRHRFRFRHWGRHHHLRGRHYWGKRHYYRKCHWHHGYKHCHYRKRHRHHH